MLNIEDGPSGIFARMRAWAARNYDGYGGLSDLLSCMFCLSIWVAIPAALFLSNSPGEFLIYWFGLSAGAILIDAMHERLQSTQ